MVARLKVEDARTKEGYRWVPYYDLKFGDTVILSTGTRVTHPDTLVATEERLNRQLKK